MRPHQYAPRSSPLLGFNPRAVDQLNDPPPAWPGACACAPHVDRASSPLSHHPTGVRADAKSFLPIHREAPSFDQQSVEMEMLTTGIKVPALPPLATPGASIFLPHPALTPITHPRWWTCSLRTRRAVRSACSAVLVSARRCSSWSSSTTLPRGTVRTRRGLFRRPNAPVGHRWRSSPPPRRSALADRRSRAGGSRGEDGRGVAQVGSPCSPAWASAPARVTICTRR